MNPLELPLPEQFASALGLKELNPVQELALKAGLLEGTNIVVASPTASGKTAVAEIAIIRHYLNRGKCVYLAPLRALASEKYEEMKEKYEKLGMKIAISTGDFDSAEEWLGRYDVIILTNEKMDSAIRHNASWISGISLVVADEVHTLGDESRGPALEAVLTMLREKTKAQILALSATISNSDEIAKWLDAKLVKSDYRPVKLHKGVVYPDDDLYRVTFWQDGDRKYELDGNNHESAVVKDTMERGKQILIFLSSRRNAESLATKIIPLCSKFLGGEEKKILQRASKDIMNALPTPTKQCEKAAECVKGGVAFHHAGLVQKQRMLIEKLFREGFLKTLTATPTLAFGVNLPSWRVLVRDVRRYSSNYGSDYIPALEVQQFCGRAGRPKYDKEGEAIIAARSESDAEMIIRRYLDSEPEPIMSQLSAESALRMHTLAIIAMGSGATTADVKKFFSKTFFGHQSGDMKKIGKQIEKILYQLEQWNFIERDFAQGDFKPAFAMTEDSIIEATELGKRAAQLYLDPLSAVNIIRNLKAQDALACLVAISTCSEMPLPNLKKAEIEEYSDVLASSNMEDAPEVWDVGYEMYLAAVKCAVILQDWMDERGEDFILDRYALPPGELYTRIRNAEWLLYAGSELALVLGKRQIANDWRKLQLRVKHGVREELLRLVEIKGIGRARARRLWRAGIRTRADIRDATEATLSRILGPKVAKGIKAEAELRKQR
ncbi:MAG: DEAD/DEAH box helicase [Candidatus Aenigmarchaeota archaeon]|nr:DEAD/DEAH box helicase [Candidatus Aenigmarchaeota archaeon]